MSTRDAGHCARRLHLFLHDVGRIRRTGVNGVNSGRSDYLRILQRLTELVSTTGGASPVWSIDGKRLFCMSNDGRQAFECAAASQPAYRRGSVVVDHAAGGTRWLPGGSPTKPQCQAAQGRTDQEEGCGVWRVGGCHDLATKGPHALKYVPQSFPAKPRLEA